MIDLKKITGIVIALLTLFGMVWAGNDYIAKQKDMEKVEECAAKLEAETAKKKELKALADEFRAWKLEDQALAIQKRLWYLEQRHGCPNCPGQIGEYRRLQHELSLIMRKLQGYYKPPIKLDDGSS